MPKSLTDKTLSGVNWNLAKTYGKTVLNIIVGIILARLLPPTDFGLLKMTFIFIGLADLFSTLGMGASVVKQKNLTDIHIATATTVTILLGISIYIIFYFSAPLIAEFYNELRLIPILRTLSIIFIVKGFTAVSYSRLVREIDFKSILVIEFGSYLFGYSIVSIILAVMGFGVWSLVFGRLATNFISSIMTLKKVPPVLNFTIGKKEFKELFAFGTGVSFSKLFNYGGNNVDNLFIGKLINSDALGLYSRAYNLMTLPISKISSGIYNVLFPAFAKVQNNTQSLRTAYFRTIKSTAFLLFPILAAMIADADYIILGLYGPKWEGAIKVFKILIFAGFLRTTLSYSGAIAHATGRVYKEVSQQVIFVIILSIGAYFGAKYYNIEGVGYAVIVALGYKFIAQSNLSIKIIESNWSSFFKVLLPGVASALVMFLIIFFSVYLLELTAAELPYPVKLLITMIIGAVTYLATIIFLPEKIKSDSFTWLLEKYGKFVPSKFKILYFKFNPIES